MSKYSLATVKEHKASKATKQLLLGSKGNPRGVDTCTFVNAVVADNNTCAPAKILKRQNEFLGLVVNNMVGHVTNLGHSVKCNNNGFLSLREKDPSF